MRLSVWRSLSSASARWCSRAIRHRQKVSRPAVRGRWNRVEPLGLHPRGDPVSALDVKVILKRSRGSMVISWVAPSTPTADTPRRSLATRQDLLRTTVRAPTASRLWSGARASAVRFLAAATTRAVVTLVTFLQKKRRRSNLSHSVGAAEYAAPQPQGPPTRPTPEEIPLQPRVASRASRTRRPRRTAQARPAQTVRQLPRMASAQGRIPRWPRNLHPPGQRNPQPRIPNPRLPRLHPPPLIGAATQGDKMRQ